MTITSRKILVARTFAFAWPGALLSPPRWSRSPLAAPAAHAADPATFAVGAATRSIDPPAGVDVYPGGFGKAPALYKEDVARQLQVKAFYVERGGRAVAFAIVDCQAWFAAYQPADNGNAQPYGISDARIDAAAAVPGGKLAANGIIVQGTHSHAAPTLEGIWGPGPRALPAARPRPDGRGHRRGRCAARGLRTCSGARSTRRT